MDVAKYIGLFLLKNNFVYIHGLGNLELRKKPASFNGDLLQGASYDVVITPSGSIDDNLANFIATNEQISISKASNALREFSTASRAELQAGRSVEIPSLGRFTDNNGKVVFITDPNLQYTPPPIPSVRIPRRTDVPAYVQPTAAAATPAARNNVRNEQPPAAVQEEYVDNGSGGGINWVRIGLLVGGLLLAIVIVFFAYRYMSRKDTIADTPLIKELPTDTAVASVVAIPDSLNMADSTATPAIIAEGGTLSFDVVLNTYDNLPKATARLKRLQSFGNNVELVSEDDSSAFYIVLPIEKVAPADTTRLMDSLKRNFNPSQGVRILK